MAILHILTYSASILAFVNGDCFQLFDSTEPISVAQFGCLAMSNYTLYIARIGTSDGKADQIGTQNIKNAIQAQNQYGIEWNGMAYFDPCTNPATCSSPSDHMLNILNAMNFSSPDVLDGIFVNISGKWPSDMATNQKWVTTYAQAAERALLSGSAFLSDKNTWENNFGTNFFVPGLDSDEGTNITWWRRWDGQANDNGFIPYSSFQSPILKQYAGQVKKCGVNINLNVGFCYQPLLPPNCTCCVFSQNNQNCGSNK